MADQLTPEQRHKCMAAIKGKNTKPEMMVRRYLHALGLRYGLHNKRLPGSPDIVLRRLKTVIFIHGCFWHGHDGCSYFKMPKSREEYWAEKIRRNRLRDSLDVQRLTAMGWKVIVVWECELRTKRRRIETLYALGRYLLDLRDNPAPAYIPSDLPEDYPLPQEEPAAIAAEAPSQYNS